MDQAIPDPRFFVQQTKQGNGPEPFHYSHPIKGIIIVDPSPVHQHHMDRHENKYTHQKRNNDPFKSVPNKAPISFPLDNELRKESSHHEKQLHAEKVNKVKQLKVDLIANVFTRAPKELLRRHEENTNMQNETKEHGRRPDEIHIVIPFVIDMNLLIHGYVKACPGSANFFSYLLALFMPPRMMSISWCP